MERIAKRAFGKLKSDAQTILKLYSKDDIQRDSLLDGFKNEIYARRKKYLSGSSNYSDQKILNTSITLATSNG